MSDSPDFISEAQDIIEAFSRGLLDIESQLRETGGYEPDLLNGAFRSIHTLKGLASLAGGGPIAGLSHTLETLLDELRLGKVPLDAQTLDTLFESVEFFGQLLSAGADPANAGVDISAFTAKLTEVSKRSTGSADEEESLRWLDPAIVSVLTEYEEHRLRENIKQGRHIFRVHASFDLAEIDTGIEGLKVALKPWGEVITYLPSVDSCDDDRLDLDILLGTGSTQEELEEGHGNPEVRFERLGPPVDDSADDEGGGGSSGSSSGGEAPPAANNGGSEAGSSGKVAMSAPANEVSALSDAPDSGRSSSSANSGAVTGSMGGGGGAPPSKDNAGSGGSSGGGSESDMTLRSLSQTVRVDLRRLDALMTSVGELGLVLANFTDLHRRITQRSVPSELSRNFRDELRTMERRLDTLRDCILDVRMVPLGQVFDKLARVVRKLGRESGKDIRLSIQGAETELDKLIVEELSDPLMHMIRNSIDHAIETVEEREARGKSRTGHIALRAYQKGNRVVIDVEDDGRGMDWRQIRETAVGRGFISEEEAADLSPRQAINLIFSPGFSTRSETTELSGRGVGMDVVKTNITRLSGMIDVKSDPGHGSKFSITLPVTLAIIQALVIRCAEETFCIPINSVIEPLMLERRDIVTVEGHDVVELRGRTLPLIPLAKMFGLHKPTLSPRDSDIIYVVVVGMAQHRVGLVVDDLLGQRDVVIKSLGRTLQHLPGIAGATELGANRTVLLLDVAQLVGEAVDDLEALAHAGGTAISV